MVSYKRGFLLLPLVAAMMTSCSTDSKEIIKAEGKAVEFQMTFGASASVTRATTLDNVWPDNSEVSISNGTNRYVYKTGGGSGTAAAGELVSLSPYSGTFYWPIDNPNWHFSAWYPSYEAPQQNITVNTDQTTAGTPEANYLKYDLLYCPPTPAPFWGVVPLTFYHQMARVLVSLNTDATEAKEQVTKVEFGGGRLNLSGSITTLGTTGDGGTTVWSVSPGTSTITMRDRTVRDGEGKNANNTYLYECMLPPQEVNDFEMSLVKITTSGAEDGVRTYTFKYALQLLAGYQTTYRLMLSEAGVVGIPTVQVMEWGSTENLNGTATIPDAGY